MPFILVVRIEFHALHQPCNKLILNAYFNPYNINATSDANALIVNESRFRESKVKRVTLNLFLSFSVYFSVATFR